MHRRSVAAVVFTVLALLSSGCIQATRHSNTMLFGTNTHLGIRAGPNATSVPEIDVGYSRQEAVVMPLVANSTDNGRYQSPCDITQPVGSDDAKFLVHPCLLVAVNGKAQDSYSVLASFGAKFDGDTNSTGAHAKGGLAQYFATGVAAQMLALKGGASVVAVGDAAAEAAKNDAVSDDTIKALFGDAAITERGTAYRTAYGAFRGKLLETIDATAPADLQAKITAFESATGATGRGIAADCTDIAACRNAVTANDAYRDLYPLKKDAFDRALEAWKAQ